MSQASSSPDTFLDRAAPIENVAQLVSASQPSSLGGELTTVEVSQHLGRSLAWVKRHAHDLGGRLVDGAYAFPAIAIERRRTTTERITLGGAPRAAEPDVGRRTAAVVRMLEDGAQCSAIVVALEETYEFVKRVRSGWIEGHTLDRQGVTFTCSCGAPSDPSTARCVRCHERAWVLTDTQIHLLRGEPAPAPNTCTCKGCKATVSVQDVDALCVRCAPRLTVAAPNGVLVVMLAGAPVRSLSIEETRRLAAQIAHHIPPPAPEEPSR